MDSIGKASGTDVRTSGSGRRVAVIVDGSPESGPALRQAASQARQRNATLDVICLLPEQADERAVTMTRVRLGELSRRACPLGVGVPVRFRVEYGDVNIVLPVIRADVELLVSGPGIDAGQVAPEPAIAPGPGAATPTADRPAASRWGTLLPRGTWLRALRHTTS